MGAVATALIASAGLLWPLAGTAQTPQSGTHVINRAFVTYADANGNALGRESTQVRTTVGTAPVLTIRKLESSDPIALGDTLTYTIEYANTGNALATQVSIEDHLSPHVRFVSATAGGFHDGAEPGGSVSWALGSLAPGTSESVTLTVQVRTPADYAPDDPDTIRQGTVIANIAAIQSKEANAETTITTTVGTTPTLSVVKTASTGSAIPGNAFVYTIEYRNTGNAAAHNVRVADELPDGTVCVAGSITGPGAIEGNTVTWTLGTLPAGAAGSLSFSVQISPLAHDGQILRNTAVMLSHELEPVLSNPVETAVVVGAAMSVVKLDYPDPVYVDNPYIHYTIRLTNNGTVPLTGVEVRDSVPDKTSFHSADSGGTHAGGVVTWTVADLAPGESRDLGLTVTVDYHQAHAGEVIHNTAVVTANEIPVPTGGAVTTISERTPGVVKFYDAGWCEIGVYPIAVERIYLEVTDPDRNTDPTAVETDVTVTLTNLQTSDSVIVHLTETGPGTGVFRGSVPTGAGADAIEITTDTTLRASYRDLLDGGVVSEDSARIQPSGIVFDSVTGTPLAGAVATLYLNTGQLANTHPDWPAGQDATVTTGADGKYGFPFAPADPGGTTYYVHITRPAEGHGYPSTVPDDQMPTITSTGEAPVIGPGWKQQDERFTLIPGDLPVQSDIPMDPPPGTHVTVSKTANRTTASIGDIVSYQLTLANSAGMAFANLEMVDTLPRGLHYLAGSTRISTDLESQPSVTGGRTLIWANLSVAANESITIEYKAVVGVDARVGKVHNSVLARWQGVVLSNTASHEIDLTKGVFTSKGTIVGKVFNDVNQDRLQGEDEKGLPGVTVYLENGAWAVTDDFGKYSFPAIQPGTHVLRIDETTMPPGSELRPLSNRFMGNAASQFVDMQPGGLHKANFAAVSATPGEPIPVPAPSSGPNRRALDGEPKAGSGVGRRTREPAGLPDPQSPDPALDLEVAIKTMNRDFAIISPTDGATTRSDHTHVVVKAPAGAKVELRVNGTAVPDERIGRRIADKARQVVLFEYISVALASGTANRIEAKLRDPFGNVRGTKTVTVQAVGKPAKLQLSFDKNEVQADGRSVLVANVHVLDKDGRAIPYRSTVTVETTAGEFVEEDADPTNAGHQVALEDGAARFTIRAPREAGEVNIDVQFDQLKTNGTAFFAPHLRDLFMVGVGEVVFGKGSTSGDFAELASGDSDWFKDGSYAGGRGAFFMKGKIATDTLLTAAYDTHKKKRDDFFCEDETDVDDEEKYPIYGDGSERGYEAQSRDKLYLRIDRGKSYAMYGDYRTDLGDARLAAHHRTFTGIKSEMKSTWLDVKAFGAETDQAQALDTIPGRGISGYYYLSHRQVVDGSETVCIETRDRLRSSRVLSREPKTRQSDYEIDYEFGTILFKTSVPSHDASLNPVTIVVSYETEGDGEKYYTYGGRAALKPHERVTLGLTAITTGNAVRDDTLTGTDLTVRLPLDTTVRLELAQSDTLFNIDGLTSAKRGSAWLVEVESKPIAGLTIKPYIQDAADYFNNPSAFDIDRGTRKQGVDAEYKIDETTRVTAKVVDEKDRLNDSTYEHASVDVEKRFGKTRIGLGFVREDANDSTASSGVNIRRFPFDIDSGSPTDRSPFDIGEETAGKTFAARLAVETKVWKNLSLTLGHQQDLRDNMHNISHAGLDLRLEGGTHLYLREEFAKYEARSEARTVFGVESEIAKNTVGFSEYRVNGGTDGKTAQQSIGLRNRFMLGDRLTGSFTVENLTTTRGAEREREPDGFAVATGFEYLALENLKLSSRLELREASDESSFLAEFGAVTRISRDYSLLAKARHFTNHFDKGGDRNTSRLLLGLAYRPIDHDRFNALTKFEYKHDEDGTGNLASTVDSYIGAVEGIYQLNARLQVVGKYAGKLSKDSGSGVYTDLVSGRIIYDISDRFDCSVGYRLMHSYDTDTLAQGGSAEVGYRVWKDLWLSVGYSLDKFDADLTGRDYQGEGPYIRIRFKFDEDTIRDLKGNGGKR